MRAPIATTTKIVPKKIVGDPTCGTIRNGASAPAKSRPNAKVVRESERRPGVAAWWERVRQRPSTDTAIFKRMTEADAAPFKNLTSDPWPKVQEMLLAAA